MPTIIDYPQVLQTMTTAGFQCNYYNSGAFGFHPGTTQLIRGWIGPPDGTIKSQFREMIRPFPVPHADNLTAAANRFWQSLGGASVWVMPKSHWHFELHDGSRDWLPGVLTEIGVDPKQLESRADGSALEFPAAQSESFQRLTTSLLQGLKVSDFSLAFPGHPIVATLHQHTQIWWTTSDPGLISRLDSLLTEPAR